MAGPGMAGRGVARAWQEHGMESGPDRLGGAGQERGMAWREQGMEQGRAYPQEQQTNNNTMEQTHSKALMAYAGQLYDAYMTGCGGIDWLDKPLPSWSDYVCNPNNKRRVEAWVDVARVAIRIETEVRDGQL